MNQNKIAIDLLIGCLIGLLSALIGVFIFLKTFTQYDFIEGLINLKSMNSLGKLITLGSILNIILFFILLKFNKEIMARGVVFATIILTIITLLV